MANKHEIKRYDSFDGRVILSLFLPGRALPSATANIVDEVVVNWSALGDVHANDALLFSEAIRDLVDQATAVLQSRS